MKRRQPDFSRQSERLQSYLDSLTRTVGHADRVVPLENYTKGLLLPLERKSVEPMAARLAPGNVRQMHQSLHHIVADAAWSDAPLLKEVRNQVLPAMTRRHRLLAWIVDDTGFPKKGSHWVGVTRCYKVNTLALIFLVAGKGERYAEGDEASPAGFFSSVGAPAKLSG